MSPEKRSPVMAKIRARDTGPERIVAGLLRDAGLTFDSHAPELPGRPDFVFPNLRIAVFVDGDFWHDWRVWVWGAKLSEVWEAKIDTKMLRDIRDFRGLRRSGRRVVRIWEHQIA